jgi:hypothetical protein
MPAFLTSQNLPNYASDPSSPADGDAYFNTTTNSVRIYVNSTALSTSRWVDLAGYQVETFTAGSYTWTRPSNVTHLKFVYAIGAGGGGQNGELKTQRGTGAIAANGASGGGSGAVVRVDNLYVGQNSTISVFVATGGSGAIAKTFTKTAGSTTVSTQGYGQASLSGSATTFGSYVSAASGYDYQGGSASSTYYSAMLINGMTGGGYGGTIDYNPGDDGAYYGWNRDAASLSQSGFSNTAASSTVVSGSSTGITAYASSSVGASTSAIPPAAGSASGVSTAASDGSFNTPGDPGAGGAGGGGTAGGGTVLGIDGTGATSGVSVSLIAGAGSNGNIGCGGGASGSAALSAAVAQYDGLTISMTVPAGGNGGDGRIYIAYVA